jgi:RHS repeat-associated protein
MVRGGNTYRIWRGSVRVVDANAGTVVETIDYDAWGNATVNDTTCAAGAVCAPFQSFGFAGGLFDSQTGLLRFGARDYDASVGRWTQKDPISLSGGINVYEYAGDDPINGSDPTGAWPWWIPSPSTAFCEEWAADCVAAAAKKNPSPNKGNPNMCWETGADPNVKWCNTCMYICIARAGFWSAAWPNDIPACRY